MGAMGSFPGLQQQGHEAVHLPAFSAEEVKNGWSDKFPVCICDSNKDNIIFHIMLYLVIFFKMGAYF